MVMAYTHCARTEQKSMLCLTRRETFDIILQGDLNVVQAYRA